MGMDMLEGELLSPNSVSELSNYIFTSKYAQYREDLQRRETWDECVDRVRDMHLRKFSPILSTEDCEAIVDAFELVRNKQVLPSARSLQYAGIAIEKNNVRMFNCATRHIDSIEAFGEYFFMLLSGCGVGVGITKRHLNKLPKFADETLLEYTYTIPDSIEGWADSLKELLTCYLVTGYRLRFDYSLIRPKGAPLKTSGGVAPGPDGLRFAHEKITEILDKANIESERLRTIDAYDILMHVADAVLSGGVRRSAVLVAFDRDDFDMMTAKTGNWREENPQRARSNNSVVFVRNRMSQEDLDEFIGHTRSYGEPGYIFADHPESLFNPCGEAGFIPILDNGDCGAQFCNLTNINGTVVHTEEELIRYAKAASLIGTLQAAYTDFPYLSYASKALTDDEALLGVSILGILANSLLYDQQTQRKASLAVVETNEVWAKKIGINPAARCTLVKPDGQSALLLGSMLSGIHPAHSKRMFRRVQVNRTDPVYQHFRQYNSLLCEPSVWSANGTDDIICFPIELTNGAKVKSELSAIEHLEIIKSTQENWVNPGKTAYNRKPINHSVSCTVIVGDDEWDEVAEYLFDNRDYFSSVSLVPQTTDKLYKQAPMEAITTRDEMIHFGTLMNNIVSVDYSKMYESTDNTVRQDVVACGGGVCELSFS
jgi:ribonucleoside-triphosphate reductase